MDCASKACPAETAVLDNTLNSKCSKMTTTVCVPATHQNYTPVCLSTSCASEAPFVVTTTPPKPHQHQQQPLHTTMFHNLHDPLTCPLPHQPQLQSTSSCTPASATSISTQQQPTEDCYAAPVYTVADFCCTPVEPTDCCAPPHTAPPQPAESRSCCSTTQPPALGETGYDLATIECCIIESALRDGMDSACCQDILQPGEVLPTQCCTEHPDVIDECCSTCCPDNQHPPTTTGRGGLTTPISALGSTISSSSSSASTCNNTLSSASPTTSSSSTTNSANYFGFQQTPATVCSQMGQLRNDVNLHDHSHWRQFHHSHGHPIHQPQGHSSQRNTMGSTGNHYHTPLQLLSYSSPDILTPPLLSEASSQASSLQVSPETKQLEEAQLDHMIKCLWTGCTAEFMSQDDLLPHVEQHLPDDVSNDHPYCQWESCATELLDWDMLIQHLQEDHHILETGTDLSANAQSCTGLVDPSAAQYSALGHNHKPGCCGHKTPTASAVFRNHALATGDATIPSPTAAISSTAPKGSSHHHTNHDGSPQEEPEHICRWKGCGRTFDSFDSLTTHLSEDHIGTGKSEYRCEWEGCERNGRLFSQRQKAMRHIQTHTGDKPYQCQICRKRFSEANIMAQHMRTHTGEKPFKCNFPGCGREFSISGALTIHKRVHTGEKPFKCKFEGCNKWFAESSNLTKHLRVHTGERPFKCPHPGCGKSFSRPDQVTRHKRTHMTEDEKLGVAGSMTAKHGQGSGNSSSSSSPGAGGDGSPVNLHLHGDGSEIGAHLATHPFQPQTTIPLVGSSSIGQERPSKRAKTNVLPRIAV